MEDKKVVVFEINGLEYGLYGEYVQSIEKMQPITRVPFTSPYIKGVFNLRGIVIPVLSLSTILKTSSSNPLHEQKIIIIRHNQLEIGLIIDDAHDVLSFSDAQIELMDEKFELSHLFTGILKLDTRLISLLNLDKVLYPERKEE